MPVRSVNKVTTSNMVQGQRQSARAKATPKPNRPKATPKSAKGRRIDVRA